MMLLYAFEIIQDFSQVDRRNNFKSRGQISSTPLHKYRKTEIPISPIFLLVFI